MRIPAFWIASKFASPASGDLTCGVIVKVTLPCEDTERQSSPFEQEVVVALDCTCNVIAGLVGSSSTPLPCTVNFC
jgi:hypothetical protein